MNIADKYTLPAPQTPRQRIAVVARHEDGTERTVHLQGAQGSWEVDYEDWWVFGGGWMYVRPTEVTRKRRPTNPNPR